jgi:DNA-binding NarL/FixJ family response regulator
MIRVFIVDASCSACDNYAPVLSSQQDIEVVGCANTLGEALVNLERCNLFLVSTNLPDDGALLFTRAVAKSQCSAQVIILGMSDVKFHILRYVEFGAYGYANHDVPADELLGMIRRIHGGEALLPPDITAALINRLSDLSAWFEEICPSTGIAQSLTRREREILHLICQDFTNRDIANHLIIEVGTVKNHVHNILAKLNVNSRREAATILTAMGHGSPRPFQRMQPNAQEQLFS